MGRLCRGFMWYLIGDKKRTAVVQRAQMGMSEEELILKMEDFIEGMNIYLKRNQKRFNIHKSKNILVT